MAGVAGGNAAVVHRMDEGMRISPAYFDGGVSAGAAVKVTPIAKYVCKLPHTYILPRRSDFPAWSAWQAEECAERSANRWGARPCNPL